MNTSNNLRDKVAVITGSTSQLGRIFANTLAKNGASNKFKDFMVVSGGYIGNKYDIIVDNYKKISFVIGVCDGSGSIMTKLDEKAQYNLNYVKKRLSLKN